MRLPGNHQTAALEELLPESAPESRSVGSRITWAPAFRAGRGLDLRWGWVDTPFGDALAACTDSGLAVLGFAAELGRGAVRTHYLEKRWPAARWREDHGAAREAVGRGSSRDAPRLHLMGTPFQIKVWRALLAIPEGSTATYAGIARRIGQPKAVRAVGGAVGANPVSWFVPCHRVVGSSGELTGFGGGLTVKRSMLVRESALPDGDYVSPAK